MSESSAFHQLGRFIFLFQHIEAALTELLVLLARADDEAIRILVNELEFSKRVKTTDVMFSWFIDLHREPNETEKTEFHKLMNDIGNLGERRNKIVHSKYSAWINADGVYGLIRQSSELRSSKGIREDKQEELLSAALEADCDKLSVALHKLEKIRLKVIDWLDH
jgi:hypothetical protein